MKEVTIKISAKFGSKFQEQFARDSLMAVFRSWRTFLNTTNKKNEVNIEINGQNIRHLDWFNWQKSKK